MALRWLSLVGVIWLQSINGTNSNFPAYSSHLKRLLSISQLELNNLAFASDAGKLFGWIAGAATAHLPLWLVLAVGAFLGFIGYGLQFLFLDGRISSLSYWQVFLLTALAGNSICWINTVCYIITIRNFPFDRQLAVGISTSYQGLSAKVYTDIVDTISPSSPGGRAKAYLLLSSTLPILICAVAAPMVRDISGEKSRRMEGGFVLMFVITIATGVYAVASSFGTVQTGLDPWVLVTGMGMFLLAPLLVPLAEEATERLQKKCLIRRERRVHHIEEVGSPERVEEGGGEVKIMEECVMQEVGPTVMLRKMEFWLYFLVYLFGPTLGLVYMNNLGQIAESRRCSRTSSLVALSSSFGFFGRLVPSFLDYFTRSKRVPSRPASIAAMMGPMACAFLFLLLNRTTASLYISTAVIGVCTGAITSLAVATTTELFGVKDFSVNHNIVVASIPIGSFVFGDSAALVYRKQSAGSGAGSCMGTQCYQSTFLLWGCLCFLGTILALILHVRTRKFYSQKI